MRYFDVQPHEQSDLEVQCCLVAVDSIELQRCHSLKFDAIFGLDAAINIYLAQQKSFAHYIDCG